MLFSVTSLRLDLWLFSLLGVLISTLHWDVFYYAFDTPKWFLFDVGLSLYLLANRSLLKLVRISWLGTLALLFIASSCILSFKAAHTSMAVEFCYRFILVAATIYCLNRKYSGSELIRLMETVIASSAICFVLVFYAERYGVKRDYNVGSFSTFGFINNLGQVFNVWLPVLIWLIIKKIRSLKWLAVLLPVTVGCVSILMEASVRACIFGLFIGEGLVFLLMLVKDFRRAILFLSTSLSLFIGIMAYTYIDGLQGGRLSDKLSAMENAIAASKARMDMFSNTMDMLVDNPLGVGTNNFEYYHPLYGRPGQSGSSPYINEHQILRTPHNIVLKIYSEQGYMGGTTFLILLVLLYIKALLNAFNGHFYDRWLLVACTALFFHSLLSAVFLTPGSLYFAIILFSLVLKRSTELAEGRGVLEVEATAPIVVVAPLAVILTSCVLVLSEYYSYKGFRTYDVQALRTAVLLNPTNDRAWYSLSHIQYRKFHDVQASLDSIGHFLQVYPYHIAANQIKSERLFQLGRYQDALDSAQFLLSYYPGYAKAQQLEQTIRNKINQGLSR